MYLVKEEKMKENKQLKKNNEDFLWDLPKNSWRLASAFGTTSIILIATVMHIFGWITDDKQWMIKGLWGVGYAAGYFLICLILKLIHENINKKEKYIPIEKLLEDVKIIKE